MEKIETYEDFQKEVLKRVGGSHGVIDTIESGLMGMIGSLFTTGMGAYADSSSMGLTNSIYIDCLEKEYKQQFEMHKQNPIYVHNLINNAVKKLKSL